MVPGQAGPAPGCPCQTSSLPRASPPSAAETTVQQDSKLVQVDLQDLGYETCGRSENEAEREETSSPGSSHVHASF